MPPVTFYVNGQVQKITDQFPLSTSLSTYLRDHLNLTGTKVYCHEGGCGSCVVSASYLDKTTNKPAEISVNSCLFPLYSCDGYCFTTVEGLGSKNKGLHPIQKRLADKNGSQCGYCSPGFVMTMYSKLKNNPKPSKEEIEKSFDGNICRCTGYRAILDSMTSFASDQNPIDIEDLTSLKCLSPECDHENKMLRIDMQNKTWFAPVSLEDLFSIFDIKEKKFRLMFGNTSIGVYKKQACFDGFINVKGIQELYRIKLENDRLTIGANCSLSNLIRIFAKYSEKFPEKFGYLKKLGQCFLKIGNVHVRNSACWAGNLALKKQFREFPSDVMTILETSGAKLNIYRNIRDLRGPMEMNIENFIHDPEIVVGEFLIESLTLDALDQEKTVCMYRKVMPRSQNAHAYVNSGFRFEFESAQSTQLVNEPLLCFNGIDENFFHAKKTQKFLENKDLLDSATFTGSVKILNDELRESGILVHKDPLLTTPDYRISLALSMYYKFYIQILHSKSKEIKMELKSLPESIVDTRQISYSEESVEIDNQSFPLTKPIPKLNAYSQTSGETKYVDDLPPSAHQTHGAFILSTIASAKIEHIDIEQALNMNGVLGIYLAKDIPGENNLMPKPFIQEPIFADKEVIYAGQPIGLVVAKTKEIAKKAAGIVQVKYTDIKKPILNIQDAIAQKSFHPKPSCGDIIKGDASSAISESIHQITGEFFHDCSQYHFFIEGIIANCEPTEDGYKIDCTTQWIDLVQRGVSIALGIKNTSSIDIQVKQLGGGFGGKITRANIPATAAAVASYHLQRPVKIMMDLNDCMNMIGNRPPWYVKYKVGFNEDGKINGMQYDWYSDPGFSPNGSYTFFAAHFFENAYKCDNIFVNTNLVKTNKPAATEVRSPDVVSSITSTEQVMEHVANFLGKDPLEVREINFFKPGDKTAYNHIFNDDFNIGAIVDELKLSSDFGNRKKNVEQFNRENEYKKKGIALIPLRYGMTYNLGFYNALVSVKHHDGSVSISHGGIEMGQGIHTKVAQACSHELGIPVEKISIKPTNNLVNPNCFWTGASVTAELCCLSVIEACKILKKNLETVRNAMPKDYTWEELIAKAFTLNCNLTAVFFQRPDSFTDLMTYDICAASCSEVLVDILTGEIQILRTDILYDGGKPINGLIDIGQAQGGFVMGIGYILLEKCIYDPESGQCVNNGTWEYKPPTSRDIPVDFRIKFLENRPNSLGVLGSKAVGEPPLVLSNSVLYAIRQAIGSARQDRGVGGHFKLDLPASIDRVQEACLINPSEFKLN